ncbi:MAG: hypothetical protein LQ344_004583 [Seirophora lacunosa]|nr:MAG: hypothetical protein LQ344_004583 [Seirophora lacunosa]
MASTESSWKGARDSPSRQLLWELSRLAVSQQEDLYERLDRDSREREATHKSALAEAIARHEKVRKNAEAERDRLEKEIQQERERRQEEARIEEERQRQNRAEEDQRLAAARAEQAARAERAERAATEERNAETARQEAEKKRREAEAAKARKAQEAEARNVAEKERKSKEEAAAAASSRPSVLAQMQPATSQPKQLQSDPIQHKSHARREAEHRRYLEIHRNLKELRVFMDQQTKQDARLKSRMGDMRRKVRKSVGQIIEGRGKNETPQRAILATLKEAKNDFPQLTVGLAGFVAHPVPDAQVPALLVYLLNQFAKAVVSQFIDEAAVAPKIADPVGTIAISMFAKDDFRVQGLSLIDILIAKFHVVCPPLFGIYGDEKTTEGRTRLGWRREEGGGAWISERSHQDRMSGLGAGYAALSLRSFEKSAMSNPYPPHHYWQALSVILNVPAGQVTDTHLYLLRALLMNSEARFMEFFGDAAKKLLRIAMVDYPQRAPKGSVAAVVLETLGATMKRDKKLYL